MAYMYFIWIKKRDKYRGNTAFKPTITTLTPTQLNMLNIEVKTLYNHDIKTPVPHTGIFQ